MVIAQLREMPTAERSGEPSQEHEYEGSAHEQTVEVDRLSRLAGQREPRRRASHRRSRVVCRHPRVTLRPPMTHRRGSAALGSGGHRNTWCDRVRSREASSRSAPRRHPGVRFWRDVTKRFALSNSRVIATGPRERPYQTGSSRDSSSTVPSTPLSSCWPRV